MRERLLDLIDRHGLGAVVMRRPENFACSRHLPAGRGDCYSL